MNIKRWHINIRLQGLCGSSSAEPLKAAHISGRYLGCSCGSEIFASLGSTLGTNVTLTPLCSPAGKPARTWSCGKHTRSRERDDSHCVTFVCAAGPVFWQLIGKRTSGWNCNHKESVGDGRRVCWESAESSSLQDGELVVTEVKQELRGADRRQLREPRPRENYEN